VGEWLQVGPTGNRAYLTVPERGTGAGVLVLHAWWGLTSVFTDVCDRLAAEGYVALAPSLYADGATAASIAEAEALRDAHDRAAAEVEAVVRAAGEQLRGLRR
jgi:carboxymethylenebutenolidase